MAVRACLPGELYLDAAIIDYRQLLDSWDRPQFPKESFAQLAKVDAAFRAGVAAKHPPFIALRWVLNPALGMPVAPFTVWRRPAKQREAATPISGFLPHANGAFSWDGVTEMLRIELTISGGAVTAFGLSANDDVVAVASTSGPGTVVLEGGSMLSVRIVGPGTITAAKGLSAITMGNGPGWTKIEIVGLPFDAAAAAGIYYQAGQQGPLGALLPPPNAAVQRLTKWGPAVGWMPLTGLPPWVQPDPSSLVQEMSQNLLPNLRTVLLQDPPPNVGKQISAEVTVPLPPIRPRLGLPAGSDPNANLKKSTARVRPLQALCMAVCSDASASVALGFGTGAPLGVPTDVPGSTPQLDDFMITAPWHGSLDISQEFPWPWPWHPGPKAQQISVAIERDLVAVVLAPKAKLPPGAPAALAPTVAYVDGAYPIDTAYLAATKVALDRPQVFPDHTRVSAYALARFDAQNTGAYTLREHPLAKGWIPVGTAESVKPPETPPDPNLPPGKVILRDSGVALPIPNAPAFSKHEYAAAAADLFGQWSPWSVAWLNIPGVPPLSPVVASVAVKAMAGSGNTEPCHLTIIAELVWHWHERSCSKMEIAVDVYDPIPPPARIPAPPPTPVNQALATLAFDPLGAPSTPTPNVTVVAVSDDGMQIFAGAHPIGTEARRFRVTISQLPVTYAGKDEKAVALYVRAAETIRPNEWSAWAFAQEAAIAPNPLAPPAPAMQPADFPRWSGLPDPAGFSKATIVWQPSSAPAYRLYEASEAALLSACGLPGPTLTASLSQRLQALYDLYKVPVNWPQLRSAYRKTSSEPLRPPVQPNGTLQTDLELPRGSALIHCCVVVALTPANLVSAWPTPPGNDGRQAFIPFVIPHTRQPALPEISATVDATGVPQITVNLGGSVIATHLRLYRATRSRLAREVGTMDVVGTFPTNPSNDLWRKTVLPDTTAVPSWQHIQYRVVALTGNDLDHAGMAVDSLPSKAYALLLPPAQLPPPTLVPNGPGSLDTLSIVRVTTTAPRLRTEVGDHLLSVVVTPTGTAPSKFPVALSALAVYPNLNAFKAQPDVAAYVTEAGGETLYLKLARTAGQNLNVVVDLVDPLGRTAHANVPVPFGPPQLTGLQLLHPLPVVTGKFFANTPPLPDPLHPWTVTIKTSNLLPPNPVQVHTVTVDNVPVIATEADLPTPAANPLKAFAIAQIGHTQPREFVFWIRAAVRLNVVIGLTGSDGHSATLAGISP